MKGLLDEYGDVISGIPGKTNSVSHTVTAGTAKPVRLATYSISQVYREWIRNELVKMMKDGIIEESRSGWGVLEVLVKKKDGSLKFCVHYRKLNTLMS